MIQDIAPHKLENSWKADKTPQDGDFVACFEGSKVLLEENGNGMFLPKVKNIKNRNNLTYLFSVDGKDIYLGNETPKSKYNIDSYSLRDLRKNPQINQAKMFSLWTAHHLYEWYGINRFCGRCGEKMQHSEKERAMVCPKCGNTVYPKIVPAVIVGVRNGDKLLLTKYARRPNIPYYALVAGFTEIGETLEGTCEREVFEETGIHVKNIHYYKSQPWALADDILAGFWCDACGDTDITIDTSELATAVWMNREDITGQPDDYSLTNEMMMKFKNGEDN